MASSSSHGRLLASVLTSASKYKRARTQSAATHRAEPYVPFSELQPTAEAVLKAFICLNWDATNPSVKYLDTEYILSDEKGSAIHCVARSSIAHCVTPKLDVGEVYSLNRITISPTKAMYRVRRGDKYFIQLEVEDIAFNGSKYLIDVVGRVINMGVSKPMLNGSKYVEFHLLNERGLPLRSLCGVYCATTS